jgi:hypothetical protein
MRPSKLTVAIVAIAASLTLAPAGASAAARHHRANDKQAGGCRVSLAMAPRLITAGETALAYGHLTCASANAEANQPVTLYVSSVLAPAYTVAGTTTTDAHGFYQLNTAALTANSRFYSIAAGAQSPHRDVKVAAQVELKGPPEGVVPDALKTGRHNIVTFTGSVSPQDEKALIVLQRQGALSGNEWHRIGVGEVGKNGAFSISHRFVAPGDANVRVVVHSGKRNVASPSNILTYEIVQAQNPELTIESSADPISYGQTVTISGVAAKAPNTPVKLLARSALTGGYAPVSEAKTNGSGAYTFPVQMPLVNTFYRVTGAGKSSAVLYEGVKFVLTAGVTSGTAPAGASAVSTTTVAAGQPLTFSGTVTPGQTGHVIYLERQNPSGVGFHVAEVGTVTASSTYSISHTFYSVGPKVMRIKIPGGPLNGSSASQPVTIEVTAAPSAAIAPEAPGNSTLPPEGQL